MTKANKIHKSSPRRHLFTKLLGLILVAAGVILGTTLVLLGSMNVALAFLCAGLALIGLCVISSTEAWLNAVEVLIWGA